jgi:hypothetical protein
MKKLFFSFAIWIIPAVSWAQTTTGNTFATQQNDGQHTVIGVVQMQLDYRGFAIPCNLSTLNCGSGGGGGGGTVIQGNSGSAAQAWYNQLVQSGSSVGSANPLYVQPTPTVITETASASTVASGGTTQTALASSTSRKGCQILNTSTVIEYVDINSTPVTPIQPNQYYTCNVASNQVDQQTIYIESATNGAGFVVTSW